MYEIQKYNPVDSTISKRLKDSHSTVTAPYSFHCSKYISFAIHSYTNNPTRFHSTSEITSTFSNARAATSIRVRNRLNKYGKNSKNIVTYRTQCNKLIEQQNKLNGIQHITLSSTVTTNNYIRLRAKWLCLVGTLSKRAKVAQCNAFDVHSCVCCD